MSELWHRRFLGKLEGFKDKEEQRFEQKHLKAYLRGDEKFKFGKDKNGYDIWHTVKQQSHSLEKQEQ